MPSILLTLVLLAFNPLLAGDSLREGIRAMEAGNYAVAAKHFQTALQQDPKNTKLLSSLAFCLAASDRFDEAAKKFRVLTKLEPKVAAHHYNLGLALRNSGIFDEAEKSFRTVLALEPGHARARVQLGNCLLSQARGGDAAKMRQAAAAYRDAVAASPDDAELRFNFAFTLARTGDEQGAMREYREVVRLAPKFPQAHFFLGITAFQLGDWEEAQSNLKQAADRGLRSFDLHYYLGSTLLRQRDLELARKHLESALRIDSEHPGVHFQLASLYRSLGDRERAASEQRIFREMTARQEARWRAEALEGAAAAALRQGELAEGINALAQAFETRPDAGLARNLALAHLQQGNDAKARLFLEKALELAPSDAASYNYLGLLLARQGDLSRARDCFEKAAASNPAFSDAWFNSGVAAAELGQFEIAAARFRAALKTSDHPRIREALAMVLADAGRHDESQKEFEAAQKLHAAGSHR